MAGRKHAEKDFLIETIVQNHIDIYQNLLKNKKIMLNMFF